MFGSLHLRQIVFSVGHFVLLMAVLMSVPGVLDLLLFREHVWPAFIYPASVAVFLSGILILSTRGCEVTLSHKDAFFLTTISWVLLAAEGSIPFQLSALHLSFTDAYFETMSGLTTTGSTVVSNLDNQPRAILLWRSMLEWLGGIGIIVFALVIFSFIRVGGLHLLRTEFSDKSEKIMPRLHHVATAIGTFYVSLTAVCTLAYMLLGMTPFDAINHAMTTVSTGGFSTHDASMGYFQNDVIYLTSAFFMLCAAMPFALYVKAIRRLSFTEILRDEQVRFLLASVAVATLLLTGWLFVMRNDLETTYTVPHAIFNIVSVITTTGYASTDYLQWGMFPIGIFFFLTFFGGCAGSTSGGYKALRFIVIYRMMKRTFF